MGIRKSAAKAVSAVSTWGLKNILGRPAANMPGKIALLVDPQIIAENAHKITKGSIMVVGTNGKTTVTNLLADALELSDQTVACNRTGANLDSGIASTLLQTKGVVDWGVFESDELWLVRSLPQIKANYVLLLNLFRDQLDRYGEIDRIQDAIVKALDESPETVLIYNADDPLCAIVAGRVKNACISFGVGEDMHLEQNTVSDAQMCQKCSGMFSYEYRQYGQLGKYTCNNCGFTRPELDYSAKNVSLKGGASFLVEGESAIADKAMDACGVNVQGGSVAGSGSAGVAGATGATGAGATSSAGTAGAPVAGAPSTPSQVSASLSVGQPGAYVVYNVLAAYLSAHFLGVSDDTFAHAADVFDPQNGRLQELFIEGRPVLLNLAKNPTGFNQNLKIITQAEGKKAVAFFINDNEADGHDISWIWDCDFEELAQEKDIVVYAGGIRKNDLQVRLKYAGINAKLINSVNEMVDEVLTMPKEWNMYSIANYTSLPSVRSALTARADKSKNVPVKEGSFTPRSSAIKVAEQAGNDQTVPGGVTAEKPLRIVHLFPDLLNLYGDGGNVKVLKKRCEWRGIPAEVVSVRYGQSVDLSEADIVFLGGGPDREQKLASEVLHSMKDSLGAYLEAGGALLSICGGYQILGKRWLLGDEEVEGLSLIDIETLRAGKGFNRLIDNIMLSSSLATMPVVGYENHAGRTYLGKGVKPFGKVVSSVGSGNNDNDKEDGVIYKNSIGTYLHGPLLGKNPEIADFLIERAVENYAKRNGLSEACALPPLDDAVEKAANAYMAQRLK